MNKIMIDLETLSTKDDAAVIAIGLALFDEDRVITCEEILVDPRYSPGHRARSTIEWWKEQDEEIHERMMSGTCMPDEACDRVILFFASACPQEVWANPPSFDLIILGNLFKACGQDVPFKYYHERDFRTMKSLAKELRLFHGIEKPKNPNKHSAVDDAVFQAEQLIAILNRLHQANP